MGVEAWSGEVFYESRGGRMVEMVGEGVSSYSGQYSQLVWFKFIYITLKFMFYIFRGW